MLREHNMPNFPNKLLAKYGFHLGLPDKGLASQTYGLSQMASVKFLLPYQHKNYFC